MEDRGIIIIPNNYYIIAASRLNIGISTPKRQPGTILNEFE